MDDDGDGQSECQGDCNDGNAAVAVYTGAAEVCDGLDNNCDGLTDNAPIPQGTPSLRVALIEGSSLLAWTPLADATGYDVVRGDLETLRGAAGDFAAAVAACVANDLNATSLPVTDAPSLGGGIFYLLRAMNCGGSGTYDSGGPSQVGSRDPEIDASPGT